MAMARQRTKRMDAAISEFNKECPVGTPVKVRLDDGSWADDVVKYPATVMGSHTPVAWLVSRGSFLLDRVHKAFTPTPA